MHGTRRLAVVVVAGVFVAACGSSAPSLPTGRHVPRTTTTTASTTTTTTLPPEWPKEVPMAQVNPRLQAYVGALAGKTVAVELDTGVFAERGPGPLGNLRAYPRGFIGLCADVHRFVTAFRIPGGFAKNAVLRIHTPHVTGTLCQYTGPPGP